MAQAVVRFCHAQGPEPMASLPLASSVPLDAMHPGFSACQPTLALQIAY